jgi:hypothetical protein
VADLVATSLRGGRKGNLLTRQMDRDDAALQLSKRQDVGNRYMPLTAGCTGHAVSMRAAPPPSQWLGDELGVLVCL